MMDLTYIGSGTIGIGGCAATEKDSFYSYRYAQGSKVYVCLSARKGVLEAVYIKRVILNLNVYGQVVPIYEDTFNGLYNEYDLCSQASAITLATAYYARQLANVNEEIANYCG